jgi:hypothetical protein
MKKPSEKLGSVRSAGQLISQPDMTLRPLDHQYQASGLT